MVASLLLICLVVASRWDEQKDLVPAHSELFLLLCRGRQERLTFCLGIAGE